MRGDADHDPASHQYRRRSPELSIGRNRTGKSGPEAALLFEYERSQEARWET
jgi:hypothetical protein